MKKLFAAILALLYISTSTGATVQVHYCMGKLTGWDIGYKQSTTCSKCGMKEVQGKGNGCCKDEQRFIKNDSDQKTSKTIIQITQVLAPDLPVSLIEIPSNNFSSVVGETPHCGASLRINGVAVYILNCVFLI